MDTSHDVLASVARTLVAKEQAANQLAAYVNRRWAETFDNIHAESRRVQDALAAQHAQQTAAVTDVCTEAYASPYRCSTVFLTARWDQRRALASGELLAARDFGKKADGLERAAREAHRAKVEAENDIRVQQCIVRRRRAVCLVAKTVQRDVENAWRTARDACRREMDSAAASTRGGVTALAAMSDARIVAATTAAMGALNRISRDALAGDADAHVAALRGMRRVLEKAHARDRCGVTPLRTHQQRVYTNSH